MTTATLSERDRYRDLHENNTHYQANNWLMDEWEFLTARLSGSLVEIGCGNGRFLLKAPEHFNPVTGVDWVCAPLVREALAKGAPVQFIEVDLTKDPLSLRADACVSADVLEHLAPETLGRVIRRMHDVAPRQFHKIACYGSDWMHPSVFTPEQWLGFFRRIDAGYSILKVENRRDREDQPVVTVVRGI